MLWIRYRFSAEELNVSGESFVEPNGIPPVSGNQIAEPLMRDLVGVDCCNTLSETPRVFIQLNEKASFPSMAVKVLNGQL